MLIALMMAIATGTLTLAIPVYHVLTVLAAIMVLAFFVQLIMRRKTHVSGGFGRLAVAGKEVCGRFKLTNNSSISAYDVSVGLFDRPLPLKLSSHPPIVGRLAPGESVDLEICLTPLRRGLYEFEGARAFTTFPLNLFRAGPHNPQQDSLLVLPNFEPISSVDVPVSPRYQPGGIALTSNVGESPEYIGNRDYRPGDPLRRIDSRAWARLAHPVVKEFQEEYYCRVALVLDTHVRRAWAPKGGFPELEAAVSLTAAAADAMSRGEYIIDLFAAGPDLYVFRSGRHTAHLENVLEILACVNSCRKNPFDVVAPALADELGNISAVIFVLLDWDSSRETLVRTAVENGCSTKVLIVRRGKTSLPYAPAEAWAGPIRKITPAEVRNGQVESI